MEKFIILDRDGVINVDLFDYVTKPADFRFEEGSLEALKKLRDNGYKIIVATNQACIGQGTASPEEIQIVNDHMVKKVKEFGGDILHIEVCSHTPEQNCSCRKPKTGLLENAEKELKIRLKGSYFLGDKYSDIQCALAHSCIPILVKTGYGETTVKNHDTQSVKTFENLFSAVNYICK